MQTVDKTEDIKANFLKNAGWHVYSRLGKNYWTKGVNRMIGTDEALKVDGQASDFWSN